jgi:hypothetical protein
MLFTFLSSLLLSSTMPVAVWQYTGGSYNETHFVQQDACLPIFHLGFGLNPSGDWEEKVDNVINPVMKVNSFS